MAGLLGTELVWVVPVLNSVPGPILQQVTTGQIGAAGANVNGLAATTNATAASTTLTAANVTGGSQEVDLNMTGALGGAANATLPTVAAVLALIPNAVNNYQYKLRIINSSSGAFAWTVLTNTGWTLVGTMTIAQNTWREFIVNFTNIVTPTATLTSVGTGTQS